MVMQAYFVDFSVIGGERAISLVKLCTRIIDRTHADSRISITGACSEEIFRISICEVDFRVRHLF